MKFSGQDLQGQESKAWSTSIEPTLGMNRLLES